MDKLSLIVTSKLRVKKTKKIIHVIDYVMKKRGIKKMIQEV